MIFIITFAALVVLVLAAVVSSWFILESAAMLSDAPCRDRKYWLMEFGLGMIGWLSIMALIAHYLT